MPLAQNQYAQYPSIPGIQPASTALQDSKNINALQPGTVGEGNLKTVLPMSQEFTNIFGKWLGSNIGQGTQPFDISSFLPSTGKFTNPGQLTAGMNPLLDDLGRFFQTGSGGKIPGLNTLKGMSDNGMPVDVGPAWDAMVAAQKRNIDQGAANIREQLAFAGNLKGSVFGHTINDYYEQAGKDQNAQLLQAHVGAQESARGRQLGASEILHNGVMQLGQLFQGIDQASVDATLKEFLRTRPEYGPLLNMMFAMATTFPPTQQSKVGGSGLGSALSGAADVGAMIAGFL